MSEPPPSNSPAGSGLNLTLRYQRPCCRAEITSVGISHSNTSAFATYAAEKTTQTWLDVFDLRTQRGLSKTSGSRAAFAPQGTHLAAVRDWTVQLAGGVELHHSSTVLIRDSVSGKTVSELKEARGGPLAWSPDGKFLAASEGGDRMGVWDVTRGVRVGRVVSHIDTVTHASFTPDGHLATLSRDGTLRITHTATSRTIRRLELETANSRLLSVGQRIVSVCGSTLHVWVPQTGDVVTAYDLRAIRRTEGWPLCVLPEGRWMACWTEEGWDVMDVVTGEVVFERKMEMLVTAGAWSSDGRMLVLGRMDGVVEVWDVEEKR